MTDNQRVLNELKNTPDEWVSNLYGRTGTMVHSRIADLRRMGYRIEMKNFGLDENGRGDYRYKLVTRP